MRMTPGWAILIAYMCLAIVLAGFLSAWPWLGILLGVAKRSFIGLTIREDAATIGWQGPHFARPRQREPRQHLIAG